MKRWDRKEGDYVERPSMDKFLNEIIELYKKHGLSLGHEDSHGGFLIERYKRSNVDWLLEASIDTE